MTAPEVGGMGEDELVARIQSLILADRADIVLGPGDDAAIVDPGCARLVLTVDSQREHIHFERHWLSPRQLGQRAVSVAVSDLAAMGAQPRWLLCALAIPGDCELAWVEGLARGLAFAAAGYGAAIVGGDVTRAVSEVAVELTAIGSLVPPDRALRRDTVVAGDSCWVTGTPGLAGAGLYLLQRGITSEAAIAAAALHAYRQPTARVRLAAELARFSRCAAMDLSDGLVADGQRMCVASRLALELDEASLCPSPLLELEPAVPQVRSLALLGGEDYELLLGLAESEAGRLVDLCARLEIPVRRIGRFVAGPPAVRLRAPDGGLSEPVATGWDPFREAS